MVAEPRLKSAQAHSSVAQELEIQPWKSEIKKDFSKIRLFPIITWAEIISADMTLTCSPGRLLLKMLRKDLTSELKKTLCTVMLPGNQSSTRSL